MEALLSLQCYDCTGNAVRDARRVIWYQAN